MTIFRQFGHVESRLPNSLIMIIQYGTRPLTLIIPARALTRHFATQDFLLSWCQSAALFDIRCAFFHSLGRNTACAEYDTPPLRYWLSALYKSSNDDKSYIIFIAWRMWWKKENFSGCFPFINDRQDLTMIQYITSPSPYTHYKGRSGAH